MVWNEEEIRLAILFNKKGYSFKDIGVKLSRSHLSVQTKLNRLGIKSSYAPGSNKGITKWSDFDWFSVQEYYNKGYSYDEIIENLSIPNSAVHWASKNGFLILRPISESLKLARLKGKMKKSSSKGMKRYRELCKFSFSLSDYPDEYDFKLIKENGWYSASNKGNNINGVSRDHMFSVQKAFTLCINPYFISHPANCKLMLQKDNNKKKTKCSITEDDLYIRVIEWDKKYKDMH